MQIKYSLNNRNDWFANKDHIAKLITPAILRKECMNHVESIQSISTSTNAVCCTTDRIVKIYAPEICGYNPMYDLEREVYALRLMEFVEIRTPRLITYGLFEYNYHFYYSIIERIHIPPVSRFLRSCSQSDILKLGDRLRSILKIFRTLFIDKPSLAKNVELHDDSVFVHSDLTGDNILYDGKTLAIIDFEDWHFAPHYVEFPAIIFEMIHNHMNLAPVFTGIPLAELKNSLYLGINAHNSSYRFIEKYNKSFSK